MTDLARVVTVILVNICDVTVTAHRLALPLRKHLFPTLVVYFSSYRPIATYFCVWKLELCVCLLIYEQLCIWWIFESLNSSVIFWISCRCKFLLYIDLYCLLIIYSLLFLFLDVLEYLQEIESLSETIHNKVQTSKMNLRKIQSVCSRWACSEPMLDDASLPLDLSTIESTEQLVTERLHKKVNDDAVTIYKLLEVCLFFSFCNKAYAYRYKLRT